MITLSKNEKVEVNADYMRFQFVSQKQTSYHPYPDHNIIDCFKNEKLALSVANEISNGEIDFDDVCDH